MTEDRDLLVLFPVDDNGCNLLIHENEYRGEDCKYRSKEHINPPGIGKNMLREEEGMGHDPVSALPGGLEGARDIQLGSWQTVEIIKQRHQEYSNYYGKVRQKSTE